ncbi:MAG TPA: aldo/keto reductase [Chitinophagaceae bacterium]|nr:aldo/keto reductase [Chitinophagaceae bacterium]
MRLNEKIGLGTVQFGIKYGIANKTGQTPAAEVTRILDKAYQYGVRIVDTASAYGNAEQVLGYNDLHRFQLVSKFMPVTIGRSLADQLNHTLFHLQIDSLYGFLAHRPMSLLENKNQWQELEYLKSDGLVKKIGYSLNNTNELTELLDNNMMPDLIQVPYNYFDNRFKEQLIELKMRGCEVHARSAFLQGLFFMNPDSLSPFFDKVKDILKNLQLTYGDHLPGVLLKYVLKLDYVDRVILGVENEYQLTENIKKMEEAPEIPEFNSAIVDSILMPSNWPNKQDQ